MKCKYCKKYNVTGSPEYPSDYCSKRCAVLDINEQAGSKKKDVRHNYFKREQTEICKAIYSWKSKKE